MGICLGSQLLNVYRGGTLHQFLPDVPRENPIEHRKAERQRPEHPVKVDLNSRIGRAIGKSEIIVNTFHKQAARTLGRGLKLVATAPDGIIEAFEDPDMPLFAAIQWHPERLHEREEHLALFRMLVEASRVY
jgi:putative glutamine amidotransferase